MNNSLMKFDEECGTPKRSSRKSCATKFAKIPSVNDDHWGKPRVMNIINKFTLKFYNQEMQIGYDNDCKE